MRPRNFKQTKPITIQWRTKNEQKKALRLHMCAPRTERANTFCVWKGCTSARIRGECEWVRACVCGAFDLTIMMIIMMLISSITYTKQNPKRQFSTMCASDRQAKRNMMRSAYSKDVAVCYSWTRKGRRRKRETTKAPHISNGATVRQLVCANTTIFYLFFSLFVRNSQAPRRHLFAAASSLQTYVRKILLSFRGPVSACTHIADT